jgi:hypothetical protein
MNGPSLKIEVNKYDPQDADDLESVAAIVAATSVFLLESSYKNTKIEQPKKSVWKYSSYWWAKPIPSVRARPN